MTEQPTRPVTAHSVTVSRVIAASPQALYGAWTEPEQLRRWFGTTVTADVRIGGRYRVEIVEADGTVNGFVGEYLTLEPGRAVAFTFTHIAQTPAHRISDETVTVTFREIGPGRTELTLVNTWTGPECEPSDYAGLQAGFGEWFDLLEKAL
ncbi:SRPBCC family protein [Pseudonocardia sp. GCM10023141]|uniref:SRPBCC family protein n=1 Tax=Pseudonocardia sp. GCM10023141 TaxID=3252653 RepID=UPI00360F4A9E